jgi:choline transport protein
MAELSSVYPTAGGQYHFASILAPPGATRWISYICGVLSVFSWVAIGAAVTVIPAQQIMAVVSSLRSTFVTRTWHVFLLYEFFALAVLLFNLFALKKHPWTHNIGCEYCPNL